MHKRARANQAFSLDYPGGNLDGFAAQREKKVPGLNLSYLDDLGYQVLRIPGYEVLRDPLRARERIENAICIAARRLRI